MSIMSTNMSKRIWYYCVICVDFLSDSESYIVKALKAKRRRGGLSFISDNMLLSLI